MKITAALLISGAMMLSLCACGGTAEPDPVQPTETPAPITYTKEDGRLKMEETYNSNGLLFSTIIYEYDEKGKLVKQAEFGISDAPTGYKSFEYDAKGQKILMTSFVADTAKDYSEEYRTNYEYDGNGNLTRATSTRDGKIVSVTAYEYKDGLLSNEKNYEGESFVASEYKYEYDAGGKKTRCVRIDNIEGDTSENRYTYTSDGLLLADLSYDADGEVISRTEYSYDDNGNAIKLSVYNARGALISSTSNEYTYDDYGNIKRCAVTHSDGSKGTTTQYRWEYAKG